MRANESRLVRGGDGRGLRSAITANQSQFAGVSPACAWGHSSRTNMAGEHILARRGARLRLRGGEADMAGEHILIVDDEPAIRSTLRDRAWRTRLPRLDGRRRRRCAPLLAESCPEGDLPRQSGWAGWTASRPSPRSSGRRPEAVVVMIFRPRHDRDAVKATRLGAYDFGREAAVAREDRQVSRALDHARLEREKRGPARELRAAGRDRRREPAIRALREQISTPRPPPPAC